MRRGMKKPKDGSFSCIAFCLRSLVLLAVHVMNNLVPLNESPILKEHVNGTQEQNVHEQLTA